MYVRQASLASLMLSVAAAKSVVTKRDSWGAAFSLGPAKADILQTTTTIYPGKMPSGQEGDLYAWLGISNGTGDLIQSIIGSYPKGQSECSGENADTTWCISSEVYSSGYQYTGELTTADVNYQNGIKLSYTLVDEDSYLWLQTMEDAVTGDLLSTFNKTSGPMLGWGTALECNDENGHSCTGTTEPQYYVNSTIILKSADASFIDTMGVGVGVTHTDMVTSDNGKTWTIAKITIPAMQSGSSSSSSTSSSPTSVYADVAVATGGYSQAGAAGGYGQQSASGASPTGGFGQGGYGGGSFSAQGAAPTGSSGQGGYGGDSGDDSYGGQSGYDSQGGDSSVRGTQTAGGFQPTGAGFGSGPQPTGGFGNEGYGFNKAKVPKYKASFAGRRVRV